MNRWLLLLCVLVGCSRPGAQGYALQKRSFWPTATIRRLLRSSARTTNRNCGCIGDSHFASLLPATFVNGHWAGKLQVGVMPGTVRVRITSGKQHTDVLFTLKLEITDSNSDGTPDFLRLEDEADRDAFRRWFRYLAEIQYFIAPERRELRNNGLLLSGSLCLSRSVERSMMARGSAASSYPSSSPFPLFTSTHSHTHC